MLGWSAAHRAGTEKETDMARRPLAAALILSASALVLTGCLPVPPTVPAAPTNGPVEPTESSEPADPGATEEPTESTDPSEPSEPSDGAFDYTVDDGAGDVWSFTVTGLEENPPMDAGEPDEGTYFVGILIDAEHLEGALRFSSSFDIMIDGDDGTTYNWSDTIEVTAEDDVFYADTAGFTQARAIVQLPEGVLPDRVVLRSAYGYPDVEDTVIDVE
jgi:hypothetical protein